MEGATPLGCAITQGMECHVTADLATFLLMAIIVFVSVILLCCIHLYYGDGQCMILDMSVDMGGGGMLIISGMSKVGLLNQIAPPSPHIHILFAVHDSNRYSYSTLRRDRSDVRNRSWLWSHYALSKRFQIQE